MSTRVCDLSITEAAEKVKCDQLGGKIISDDILFCKEDFNSDDWPGGDVRINNAPICLASSCKENTQLVHLFSSMRSVLALMVTGGTVREPCLT